MLPEDGGYPLKMEWKWRKVHWVYWLIAIVTVVQQTAVVLISKSSNSKTGFAALVEDNRWLLVGVAWLQAALSPLIGVVLARSLRSALRRMGATMLFVPIGVGRSPFRPPNLYGLVHCVTVMYCAAAVVCLIAASMIDGIIALMAPATALAGVGFQWGARLALRSRKGERERDTGLNLDK